MTVRARLVLDDCRIAHAMLEDITDLTIWRIQWLGALALLRAVGSVLDKIDGQDEVLKRVQKSAYKTWKTDEKHRIFNDFIGRERNNALKEYEFNYSPEENISVCVIVDGQCHTHPLDENIFRPIVDGFGVGEDARDVYKEAIDWWQDRLDEIDEAVSLDRSRQP